MHARVLGDSDLTSPAAQGGRETGGPRIAVLIPCHNEAATVAKVVADFRRVLPRAAVYVYDNNCDDETAAVAAKAGAHVRRAPLRGKGNVVRRMFSDVEADLYLLVDGDDTYDAASAPMMLARLVSEGLDMVSGARVSSDQAAYRRGHRTGNRVLTALVRAIFGRQFEDMLTGYRVFSRRFVKSFPAHSEGFEIETELTVHTLQMRLPSAEVETPYGARPDGSASKLSTIRDGLRILRMIGLLVREERPLQFFSLVTLIAAVLSGLLVAPVVIDYLATGYVPRYPSLIVSVGLGLVALLSFACGLVLDTVSRARLEQRRLAYLNLAGPQDLTLEEVSSVRQIVG
ncbi:MAG TPA: glycosyltransferase family 2 protein [Caulobacteraceae bacterium]|nr:glycosyltransferase family 2 protein [Caulobacteraceae bacterium]